MFPLKRVINPYRFFMPPQNLSRVRHLFFEQKPVELPETSEEDLQAVLKKCREKCFKPSPVTIFAPKEPVNNSKPFELFDALSRDEHIALLQRMIKETSKEGEGVIVPCKKGQCFYVATINRLFAHSAPTWESLDDARKSPREAYAGVRSMTLRKMLTEDASLVFDPKDKAYFFPKHTPWEFAPNPRLEALLDKVEQYLPGSRGNRGP